MENKQNINRRKFLGTLAIGAGAAAGASVLSSCGKSGGKLSPEGHPSDDVPKGKMTLRTNHNTGDKVSLLGYGAMRFLTQPTADGKGATIDQENVNHLIDYAFEHGVNYYDTSPRYLQGLSEPALGTALARHDRKKYFIATKMSNFDKADWSHEASVEMYRQSMKNLHTDYIDYYLLHAIGGGEDGMAEFNSRFIDNGILDFLLEERKAGRIRNLGFSFHGDQKVYDHALAMDVKWDFVQIQLNYVDWKHPGEGNVAAEYLYNELLKRNIPAVVMEPLRGSTLANLSDFIVEKMKTKRPDDSVASWAFRYAGHFPNVLTALSGMTYMEHLQDNIRTYSPLVPLDDSDLKLLEEAAQSVINNKTIPCTNCKYCMPCPYGLDIPGIFAHFNKCVNAGYLLQKEGTSEYEKARRGFLIGYDRSVPKLRQADHCIHCKKCVPKCPQEIPIPKNMSMIDEYVEKFKQDISL